MIRIILIGITIFFLSIMSFFVLGFTTAKADTKSEAIVGHVITQVIQGNDMDHAEVMTNELAALMHKFSIEITSALLQNMPNILDSISAELRAQADLKYKCSIQSEYIKDKKCK